MDSFRITRLRLASDSGHSSCSNDTVSLQDFGIQPVLDFFIKEKIKQMEQVAENIKRAKDRLLLKYADVNKEIDFSIKQSCCIAEAKSKELKTELREIASSEVLSWNIQLKICKEAEDWLENVKNGFSPFDESLQETCNMYARKIGFIRSPEIFFDDGSASTQNHFENIGNDLRSRIIQSNCVEKIKPKFCVGRKGRNVGEFSRPWGVCSDLTGRILVADRGNHRIQVFNECGRFLLKFGKFGVFPGHFNQPIGITVDKKFRIIVTDKNNHRVQVFTFTGEFIFYFGRSGHKQGQFQYPWDVDTNSEDEIAVSDTKNHRVQLFDKNGSFVSEFRFENFIQGPVHSVCPIGVAFKPDGALLITDVKNSIIFKIDKRFSTITTVQGNLKFCTPQGIACNSNGTLIVTDNKHNSILVFDNKEKLQRVLEAEYPSEFYNLQGICFHPNGSIIVVDFKNNRIHVF